MPVAIGQYREDGVVVTSGVSHGDWIVAAGVHKLVPGQVVRPYDGGPTSALAPTFSREREKGTGRRSCLARGKRERGSGCRFRCERSRRRGRCRDRGGEGAGMRS